MYSYRSISVYLKPLLSRKTYSPVTTAYARVRFQNISTRAVTSRVSRTKEHLSQPEPFTPPLVVQRAVSSLLNDALKNGTFSWDYTIAACLSVLLYSLAYKELNSCITNVGITRKTNLLQYHSVNLRLEKGRLLASFDLTMRRRKHVCHVLEHTDPDHNSIDIVKLLYIHARRVGGLETSSLNVGRGLTWSQPEWHVIPYMAPSFDLIYPERRSIPGDRQLEYVWHLAALAADLHVPDSEYDAMIPFIESTLPDHCIPPDFSALDPQLRSESREFVEIFSNKSESTSVDAQERSRQKWLERMNTFHRCPFGCGGSSNTAYGLKAHMRICQYRTEQMKAQSLLNEAKKTLPCPYCDARFETFAKQQKHIKWQHQRYELFCCPESGCKSHFTTISGWYSHFELRHVRRAFKCPFCTKGPSIHLSAHLVQSHPEVSKEDRAALLQAERSKAKPSTAFRNRYHKLVLKPVPPIVSIPTRRFARRTEPKASNGMQE